MANIYVITGPSGVGKTTVARELLKRRPTLRKVVTCTTRPPRPGERDGADYHFLTTEEFHRLVDEGKMFESAHHYGNDYGSRAEDVRSLIEQNNDVVFVVDVEGAKSIRRDHPETTVVFLDAESTEDLIARMETRDKGATDGRSERIASIERERTFGATCDHRVVNTDGQLEATVATIDKIMNNR